MNRKYITEDQSKNGVHVIVRIFADGRTVEASCECHGTEFRMHSTEHCPNRLRIIAQQAAKDAAP